MKEKRRKRDKKERKRKKRHVNHPMGRTKKKNRMRGRNIMPPTLPDLRFLHFQNIALSVF